MSKCIGWRFYHQGSPDYFNPCGTSAAWVPSNNFGYQYPASGNSYAGAATYSGSIAIYKEYMAAQIMPLTAGLFYEVSISVSLADISGMSTNDLGVWFYDNGPTTTTTATPAIIPGTPQVSYSGYGNIADSGNWVRLTGYFLADSAYDNIVIGGFGDLTACNPTPVGYTTVFSNIAYYYIDSVVVKAIPFTSVNFLDTVLCKGDTIHVPYNAYGTFTSGNKFKLQLSNSSGSFSTPINLDSVISTSSGTLAGVIPVSIISGSGYRIRVVSTSPIVQFLDNRKNISIGVHPTGISATALATTICARDSLQLYGSSTTSNVSYFWSGPSSYSSGSQNPVIYNAATTASGKYVLTVSNYGCKTKDSVTVTVNPSPNTITASYNSPLCEADTLKLFSTNSSSGVIWGWTGPGSYSAAVQNPIQLNATSAMSGKYYVTATAANGCKAKDSVDVVVKPLPANFSASTNAPVCQNNTVNLFGSTTSSGVTWSWSGPSFSSTLQNPAISSAQPSASGDYILTATLNGCSLKDTVAVVVNPIPAAPTASANTPVCVGQDLQLNAATVSGASYSWTGPGGFNSTSQNPVRTNATTAMAGQYSVHATVAACVSADASVTVSVIPAPSILMYLSPNDSICQGSTVSFSTNVTNAGTGAAYKWFKNNSPIIGATNSTYSTNTAADYDSFFCTITSNGTCASAYTDSSTSITMRVFPWLAPAVSIAANPITPVKKGDLINFTATPVNGGNTPRYQWKRNSKDVVGAISNVWGAYTLDDHDTICVVLTSSYLCPQPPTAKSNCIVVNINTTGISSINNDKLKIYPNPVTDELIIEGIDSNTNLSLYDMLGKQVLNQNVHDDHIAIDMRIFPKGTYLLHINYNNGQSATAKVIKD